LRLDPKPCLFYSLRLVVSRCQAFEPAEVVLPIVRIDELAVRMVVLVKRMLVKRMLPDLYVLLIAMH
jgi:hypothetical protein